jgi:MFS family permease
MPSPFLPFSEPVRVGILISLYGIVNALLQPLMGALSDRLGQRKLFIFLGLVLMGVATLGFIPATVFTELLFLRMLQGVAVAITVPASLALMAEASPANVRGGSMGIYTTMRMVGFGAGPLIGGFLVVHSGYNVTFLAGALFILFGIIAVQLWVKDIKPLHPPKAGVRFKMIDRKLINIGVVGAGVATFMMASDFSMISTLETQFNSRLNQNAFIFGLAFSALIISRLIFQIPLGHFSDRFGRQPFIVAGLIMIAPVTFLLGRVTNTFQFFTVLVLQGVASAAIAAPAFALAADYSSVGGEGRQMSLVTMGFGLGIALGPLLAGVLVSYSFILPFFIGGILTILVAAFIFFYVPDKIKRQVPSPDHVADR